MTRRTRINPLRLILILILAACAVFFIIYFLSANQKFTSFDINSLAKVEPEILIPVTDFYDPISNISSAELENYEQGTLSELTPDKKVLSVDGKYPLDELKEKEGLLTINQTGTTALARRLQIKLREVGSGAFFAEKIGDFLANTDFTHVSNEVSFAEDCGIELTMTLCSSWGMYDALERAGVDIVELTGNHNNDWGATANLATIDFYHEKGIKTFGGGKTEEEASVPLQISDKNTNITWLAINNSTSSKANGQGATSDHPGANIYDEATTRAQITEAKSRGDYVIVDVQFSECYCYPDYGEEYPACDGPISGQTEFFRSLIDMGADMVVGTQAHQPQTFELYQGKPIYYGLGNLFFDQTMWPGTTRGYILTHYFKDGKLLQTRISPTVYDTSYQTELTQPEVAQDFLARLISASPRGN